MATTVRGGRPAQPTPLSRLTPKKRRAIEKGAQRARFELDQTSYHHALAFHPGGHLLATAARGDLVLVHLDEGGRFERLPSHSDALDSLAFDETGDRLVTAGRDGQLRAWHLPTRTSRFVQASKDRIHSLALTRDGRTAYVVGDESVLAVVDLSEEGHPIKRYPGHRPYCWAVGLSDDEQCIISSDSAGDVRIWSAEGQHLATLTHSGSTPPTKVPFWPVSIRFRPGSHQAWLACRTGGVVLLDASAPSPVITRLLTGGHTGCITDALYLEGPEVLVTASQDMCLSFWDTRAPDDDALRLTLKPHTKAVLRLALSHDGQTLASIGDEGAIVLWDVEALVAAVRSP